jgi:hypothetical protein
VGAGVSALLGRVLPLAALPVTNAAVPAAVAPAVDPSADGLAAVEP